MATPIEQPTFLYRLYDRWGALLYVGITGNMKRRMADHARTKPWWPLVARTEVTPYLSRPDAEHAEWLAIDAEAPVWNVDGGIRPRAVPREPRLLRWDDPVAVARALGVTLHMLPASDRARRNAVSLALHAGGLRRPPVRSAW